MDELRWGILGTADISETVIPAIQAARGARAVAVASRNGERARVWAERFSLPRSFDSYEALLHSGEVDAVYLPLPNALHADWTIRALEAGLPVLCEKPLAPTEAAARSVAAAALRTGLPVMEGFMYRFHAQWKKLQELLDAGTIGPLQTIDAVFSFFLDDRDGIVASADLAGGALLDVGSYAVHAARMITKEEPVRTAALARFAETDDTMVGLLEFPSGVLARFETSIATAERHRVELRGTKGTLVLPHPWVPEPDEATIVLQRHAMPDQHYEVPSCPNPYQQEIEHFGDVVRGTATPQLPLDDAIANAKVLEALARAARDRG